MEGRSRRQAGGEAGNAAEVASARHGATGELGDVKEAPNDRWRRLSVVVRSTAHDIEEIQREGSHPRSVAVGCRVGEAHHVDVVLGEVSAGTAQPRDHFSPMLASAAPANGRRLRGGLRLSMVVAQVLERDGASTATSWWCRLDWRRAGAACCRRHPCRSWTGRWLVLLAAGSSRCSRRRRWRESIGGRTVRRCSDGLRTATQAWRSGVERFRQGWSGPRRRPSLRPWARCRE
jgi:hypothetical protein